MLERSLVDLESKYELELVKVAEAIKKNRSKKVILQFPDGLKPYATLIAEELSKNTGSEIFIWFGSCFGACDIPLETKQLGIDLIVQFGHSAWPYTNDEVKVIK